VLKKLSKSEELEMTMHLSVRLPWHDRCWDGKICNNPQANVFCGGLYSVNAEVIRQNKDTPWEEANRGKDCQNTDKLPPCSLTINTYAKGKINHTHFPKIFLGNNVEPVEEPIPPFTAGTWAYDQMYEPGTSERYAADVQDRQIAEYFDQFECGRSLVFFYLNYDNPLNPENRKYVVVGISRLIEIGDQLRWKGMDEEREALLGNMIWNRMISHKYPDEGVRIPYEEYLKKNKPFDHILFEVEGDLARRFKYVSRGFTDDDAAILIERMIEIVQRLKKDNIVEGVDWDRKLEWLNRVLSEVWKNRGLFPGIGSVLEYLNFPNGTTYVRTDLRKMPCEKVKDYVFDIIERKKEPNQKNRVAYEIARKRWKSLPDLIRKLLKDQFCTFEISDDQIKRILSEERENWSITSSLQEIYDNPYCIAEEYQGEDPDDNIGFHRIDNGMMPSQELKATWRIRPDDDRRVRAVMVQKLKTAASNGHTFLSQKDLLGLLKKEEQLKGSSEVDIFKIEASKDFYEKKLAIMPWKDSHLFYLRIYCDHENLIRERLNKLMKRDLIGSSKIPWDTYLPRNKKNKRFQEAITEQAAALEKMYQSAFSVLSGAAGTGKTTVLKALIDGIHSKQVGQTFLLLAPTGKAAVRMSERTDHEAMTIHRILMKNGWINENTYQLKLSGGEKISDYQNIIIDEASMVDLPLLGTLFRAIDWNVVQRLILVGDPNQLPPIGVGKPFADTVAFLKKSTKLANYLSILSVNCRQIEEQSVTLAFANTFIESQDLADEDLLTKIAEGNKVGKDFEVRYWKDETDLSDVLRTAFNDILKEEIDDFDQARPYEAFNELLGLNEESAERSLSRLQILSPYRGHYYGTDPINLWMQDYLRKGTYWPSLGFARLDKVIQIANINIRKNWKIAWDPSKNTHVDSYLFNGALGYVNPFKDRTKEHKLCAVFDTAPNTLFFLTKSFAKKNLELGYAISVHKSQGSEFDTVILVIPSEKLGLISRELFYTALTRSTKRLILLLQQDITAILHARWPGNSVLLQRNTSLFKVWEAPKEIEKFKPENLIHTTIREELVRSKSELIIANLLAAHGVSYYYEKPLKASETDFKIPDFTIKYEGKEYYWEHLGLWPEEEYQEYWRKKEKWYKDHGFFDRLIVTKEEVGFNSKKVEDIIKTRFS